MKKEGSYKGSRYLRWKKKDNFAIFLILAIGLVMTLIGFLYPDFYNLYISLCLGLFIGGFLLSIISTFLAQMESNISGTGELDAEVDVDIDAEVDIDVDAEVDVDFDAEIDVDIDAEVDVDIDAEIDVDVDAEVDVDIDAEVDADIDAEMEVEIEGEVDSDIVSTVTPAPIMLLFSTALLVYGISGLSLYFLSNEEIRYYIFFITPAISFLSVKVINSFWKVLAKSRYYRISSTKNLIGTVGEVILKVDNRGGIIKVHSNTPLKFERLHVKPLIDRAIFERGDQVYICDVQNGYLLVDNSKKSIRKKR
ncbi:MAG: hypothetical protein ACXABO_17005 [Promethearchaeota archaeon]|jgi:hypothetical protein